MGTRSGIYGADPLERSHAGEIRQRMRSEASTPSHDPNDFETVSGPEGAFNELGGSHGLPIVFHDHTAREQPPPHEELLDGAWELGRNGFAIGDHGHRQSVVWWPRK